eukprot:505819-Prorocentrum_minimum.AAC.1
MLRFRFPPRTLFIILGAIAPVALAVDCNAPLVSITFAPSDTCAGENVHNWPIGMSAESCHGWRGVDGTGREHLNSAKGIKCNSDGTFQYTQYAGNLDCSVGGVTKTYTLNECKQDIPPTLYGKMTNNACCVNPSSSECQTGFPAAGNARLQTTIYLNGTLCDSPSDPTVTPSSTPSPTATPSPASRPTPPPSGGTPSTSSSTKGVPKWGIVPAVVVFWVAARFV